MLSVSIILARDKSPTLQQGTSWDYEIWISHNNACKDYVSLVPRKERQHFGSLGMSDRIKIVHENVVSGNGDWIQLTHIGFSNGLFFKHDSRLWTLKIWRFLGYLSDSRLL
jgi:hypothetical protein